MDQDYQNIYPEGDLHEITDYAGRGIASSRREDLQGIMGPPPVPMSYMGQHSSISDLTGSNPYGIQYLMASGPAGDAIQDLRLSPVQHNMRYAEVDRGYNAGFKNGLFNASTEQEDAWNPLRITGVSQVSMPDADQALTKRRRKNGSDDGTIHPSKKAYSDIGSQSHNGPPSDSGYGTKSGATGSVAESFHFEDRLAVAPYGTRTVARNSISFPSQFNPGGDGQSPELQSQSGSDAFPLQEKHPFKCDWDSCLWAGKNLSDKKKHALRHLKLHKCDQKGCKYKKEGFGTVNDLDRHRQAVHGLEPQNGESAKFYKCFAGNCSRKDKKWPRKDNFRKHLQRIHGEESVDELMKKSETWYDTTKRVLQEPQNIPYVPPRSGPTQAPVVSTLPTRRSKSSTPSVGPWVQDNIKERASGDSVMPTDLSKDSDSVIGHSGLTSVESLDPDMENSATTFDTEHSPAPDIRDRQEASSNSALVTNPRHRQGSSANSPRGQSNPQTYSLPSFMPSDNWDDPVTKTAIDLMRGLEKQLAVWDERRRLLDGSHFPRHTTPIGEPFSVSDAMQKNKDELQMMLFGGLRQIGVQPGNIDSSHPRTSDDQSNVGHNQQRQKYECEVCKKKVDRKSQLKKHMKRHDRPYWCTFPECSQSFGSKNDWKRHENSQHFRLQSWRCHIKSEIYPFPECNRLFYRREKFTAHLNQQHKVTDEGKIAAFLQNNEIGRNGQSRFWCGFCREIIALRHRGRDAFNERFNHIDDRHFKKGQTIETWQHPEIHSSDSPIADDHYGDENGEEPPEGDYDHSSDAETSLNDSENGKRTVQKSTVVPIIRINSDQTTENESSTETHRRSPRPSLKLDTSSPHSAVPQSHKRKFATRSMAASAMTQSHGFNQGRSGSNKIMASRSVVGPSSAPNRMPSSQANSSFNTSLSRVNRATAAALFSTTYPAKQARNVSPSEAVFCCHCSGQMMEKSLIVKDILSTCVVCEHRVCDDCPPSQ